MALRVAILVLSGAAAAAAGVALRRGAGRGLLLPALLLAVAAIPVALVTKTREGRKTGAGDESLPRDALRFTPYNFRFAPPPDPWVRLDTARLGGDAIATFLRTDPKIVFSIGAESGDQANPTTAEAVAENLLGELRSGARSFQLLEQRPYPVNGLAGLLLVAERDAPAGNERFVCWVYALNGFTYELRGRSASGGTRREVQDEVERLLQGFEILDRERPASGHPVPAEAFRSASYGYEVGPGAGGWYAWTRADQDIPGAEYGLFTADDVSLAVVPISLLGHDPDQETLAQGLLERLDIPYPNDALSACRTVSLGDVSGCDYDFERAEEGGHYLYRLRVVKGRGFGYLVASWLPRGSGRKGRHRLDEAQALVRFAKERPTPFGAPALLPARRAPYSMVFNEMGLACYGKERYEEALSYFRVAFELDEIDPVLLENVVEAFTALGRYRDALDYLSRHGRGFPHASRLEDWRDFLKDQIDEEREESLGKKSARLATSLLPRA